MGDPLNARLTGLVVNQDDLPYWCVEILHWIGMVSAMQQATGKIGSDYRPLVDMALDGSLSYDYVSKGGKKRKLHGPAAVYGIYADFCTAVELQANK